MQSIFLSDTNYEQLASQTEDLISHLDNLPYPKVKDDVHQLLQNFDMLHREALTRLFKEIIINHPDLQTKMESDKAVNLLFSLYDLFNTDIQNGALTHEDLSGNNGNDKYPRWIPVGKVNALKENAAYKYAEEALNLARSDGDSMKIVRSGRLCGQLLRRLDRLGESTILFDEMLPIAKRHHFNEELKLILNGLALTHTFLANYDKALAYNFESLILREKDGKLDEVSLALNNIGLVYFKLRNYEI